MIAGQVGTTMEEECREILQSVEEAMQQEMRGAGGCTAPDGARIAACLHLQRAALRSVMMPTTMPKLLAAHGLQAKRSMAAGSRAPNLAVTVLASYRTAIVIDGLNWLG
jgi:hypothetical protein